MIKISSFGFGGYRIHPGEEGHRAALRAALRGGVNLVDTSSNYTDGGSETLIGQVLAELFGAGELDRGRVVVVSKAGYLQGTALASAQARAAAGRGFAEVVPYAEGLWHCLHPEFLADQLGRSLARLGLARLDAYLLHNPEYYLAWARAQGVPPAQAREELYGRIGRAFAHLEGEVAAGRLAAYGVSGNTLVAPARDPEFLSLARLWELARAAGGEGHHFRVVEFPLNLLETGAATEANQPGGRTLLGLARELGLCTLVNRPLNAVRAGVLLRLAETPAGGPPAKQAIVQLLDELLASEGRLRNSLLPNLGLDPGQAAALGGQLAVAQLLATEWEGLSGLEHWRAFWGQYLVPRLNAALLALARRLKDSREGLAALADHQARAARAAEAIAGHHQALAAGRCARLRALAAGLGPAWGQAPDLPSLALRALRAIPGVGCVLLGMRREAYVAHALAELARPADPPPDAGFWPALAAWHW